MPSEESPGPADDVGAKALEAVKVGATLNADHRADPGGLRSIGTCRICRIFCYQTQDGTWKHVPSIEECDHAEYWIRQRRDLVSMSHQPSDTRFS